MRRLAAALAFVIVGCGATQTDPPDRPLGAPARDGGAGGGNGNADGGAPTTDGGSDDGSTTVNVGDDSGKPARVDAPECTTSNMFAVPSAPANGLALAAYSVIGFSGTQGKCGWSYGYIAPATSTTTFLLMGEYDATGEAWYVQNTVYWTYMNRNTMHPNGLLTSGGRTAIDHWAVRRWTSNVNGQVRITGSVKKSSGAIGGNGVLARIMVGANKMFDQNIVDETGATFDIDATVAIDTTIDFVIDPNASEDGVDSTDFVSAIWK